MGVVWRLWSIGLKTLCIELKGEWVKIKELIPLKNGAMTEPKANVISSLQEMRQLEQSMLLVYQEKQEIIQLSKRLVSESWEFEMWRGRTLTERGI